MSGINRNGAAKIRSTANSPRSPISWKTSFRSRNESMSMKIEKKPPGSPSLSSNKSKSFSQLQSKPKKQIVSQNVSDNASDFGPFLLNQARSLLADNPAHALQFALRASKSFEKYSNGDPNLDLVMSLHVLALILCKLEQYDEALSMLERAIEIPDLEQGHDHCLAKFCGYMQLGDAFARLSELENAIQCYKMGLDVQKHALGENDYRVGDTYRFIAEAHMQLFKFDEAERFCLKALELCKGHGTNDRRLLALIYDMKGNYEGALEQLIIASLDLMSKGQEIEMATIDCSIGDAYVSLDRFDEALFSYQKALTLFRSIKGGNDATVALVLVRLAKVYNKIGKFRESKSNCETAVQIYENPLSKTPLEEIANGFTEISTLYENMEEPGQAIKLLQKALNIYSSLPCQQSMIAGVEVQLGVLYYMTGDYDESYNSLKNAVSKLRLCGEKKPAFFGSVLNQMGLICVEKNAISEAADLFEEARSVLERDCGPDHPDTLGVCSNLAGTYDAMGRSDEAIEILQHVVKVREEKLVTADADVDDEKRRLSLILKESKRSAWSGHRKTRSLEELLDTVGFVYRKGNIVFLNNQTITV